MNSHGDMMAYFKGGPSGAVGVTAGGQVAAQKGTLNDIVAPTGEGGGVSLTVAPGVVRPSGSVIFDDSGKPVGGAIGAKGGLGVSVDISNGGVATGTVSLVDLAKDLWKNVKQFNVDFFSPTIQGPPR